MVHVYAEGKNHSSVQLGNCQLAKCNVSLPPATSRC